MYLNPKTLEKLRLLINEETEYRSGPKLVDFFNKFGFTDEYVQGFPSRWQYTDEKLFKLNNTGLLDMCIKDLFNPINFIGRISILDKYISEFNEYLSFDKKEIVRNNNQISIRDTKEVKILKDKKQDTIQIQKNKPDQISYKEWYERPFGIIILGVITGFIILWLGFYLGWN